MSRTRSTWAGAVREWCAYEVTTDLMWWRWDVLGIDREGEFVQIHCMDKKSHRGVGAMRKRAITKLKRLARTLGMKPIHGVLELPEGAHKARFL